ncbi:MAG: hypothetical protein C0392_11595 [Syntrophus sp. (in: bacteria)]|nr:hypothetical protein [Syntrophus sp. (in: bacteria)]
MGFFDLLFGGKRIEEMKMAFVGKYVFLYQCDDRMRADIIDLANMRLSESIGREIDLEAYPERVRYTCYAHAMAELGIEHGVKGYRWYYVSHPLMADIRDERLWQTTKRIMKQKYDVDVDLPRDNKA